MPRVPIKN